jgi:HK97 family phage major capsid protein
MSRNAVLEDLRTERDRARDAALELVSSADYEPGSEALKGLEERAAHLDTQIERMVRLIESQDAADALDGRLAKGARQQERAAQQPETRDLSWGEQFTRSDVWAEYPFRGTSGKLDVETRALPHSLVTMADALPSSPIYDITPPSPPDLIIPLVSVVTVSTNGIDFITWKVKAGSAEIVGEGQLKPSIEWEPDVTSSSLDTVAAWTSFTRQLAEDSNAVTSFINGELQREISRKVEAEAKAALAAATLPTATGPAGAGVSGAIRKGKAVVQAAGYSANLVLLSADDLIDIDIESMSQFRGDPLWGLTPIVDPDMDAGDPVLVMDGKAAVQHYRRNAVQLFASDSATADSFLKNVLHVLAEQRAKTVVTRPAAGARVTAGA